MKFAAEDADAENGKRFKFLMLITFPCVLVVTLDFSIRYAANLLCLLVRLFVRSFGCAFIYNLNVCVCVCLHLIQKAINTTR